LAPANRSQIPNDPLNVRMYISREERGEDIVMGQATHRSEEEMAKKLAEWETMWRASGGQ